MIYQSRRRWPNHQSPSFEIILSTSSTMLISCFVPFNDCSMSYSSIMSCSAGILFPDPLIPVISSVAVTLSDGPPMAMIRCFLFYIYNYYDIRIDYRKIETKKIKSDYIECLLKKELNLLNFI